MKHKFNDSCGAGTVGHVLPLGNRKNQLSAVYTVPASGKSNFAFLSGKWRGFGGKDWTCLLHSAVPDSLQSAEGQLLLPSEVEGTDFLQGLV